MQKKDQESVDIVLHPPVSSLVEGEKPGGAQHENTDNDSPDNRPPGFGQRCPPNGGDKGANRFDGGELTGATLKNTANNTASK